ncbi:MAG: hypothetical protein NUV80_00875 [Candidatus Berkelbacteria bacterium]|nr:hypothetical protein [Candidatus Berkelbacteria bacterium]
MIYPENESLYMQLDWYQNRLKPFIESKTLSYWAENPKLYKWAKETEEHYIKAIAVLKS